MIADSRSGQDGSRAARPSIPGVGQKEACAGESGVLEEDDVARSHPLPMIIVVSMIAIAWLGVLAAACAVCRSAAAGDRVFVLRESAQPRRFRRLLT